MALNAVMIDDDESNLSSLGEKLAKHCPQVTVIARCSNGAAGIEAIERLLPDLVFLDIEMPVMNGFLMLQQLVYKNFALIFVTAYDHYAIKAIRYSALDYLVKPVEIGDLQAAVTRAVANRHNRHEHSQIDLLLEHFTKKKLERISIPTADGLQFINLQDVVYLEASDNYTNIFMITGRKFLVSRTLKIFEELLPPDIFLRIHHGNIVNKFQVERYIRGDGGQVVMRNGAVLDVSKRKKTEFLEAISQ